jgi:diaminopimelate epimerase
MLLKFTKMHGCGNDFMVIDLVSQYAKLRPQLIPQWADRNFGIGFDQLLVVEPPLSAAADFRYRIFNADGEEVEQCGNGARCFALFVRDKQLTRKEHLVVETKGGVIELHITGNNQVTVDMGKPILTPEKVPFIAEKQAISYDIIVNEQPLDISAVSMGNPHSVTIVDDVDTADVKTLGPLVENHRRFPRRTNAGFMQIISRSEIRLRVYERGAGETLACGTGACAAVVAGRLRGLLDETVTVHLPGGSLSISWAGEDATVKMTGPCQKVFEGRIYI